MKINFTDKRVIICSAALFLSLLFISGTILTRQPYVPTAEVIYLLKLSNASLEQKDEIEGHLKTLALEEKQGKSEFCGSYTVRQKENANVLRAGLKHDLEDRKLTKMEYQHWLYWFEGRCNTV